VIGRFLHRVIWAAHLVENRGMTWRRAWRLAGFYQRLIAAYFGGRDGVD
jgi:hypothetical protein